MTVRKVQETMEGFGESFYPPHIDELNVLYKQWVEYNHCKQNTSVLEEIGGLVKGSHRSRRLRQTASGYRWARCLEFEIERNGTLVGIALIAFPHCLNADDHTAPRIDRSVALFGEKAVEKQELEELAARFLEQFKKHPATRVS